MLRKLAFCSLLLPGWVHSQVYPDFATGERPHPGVETPCISEQAYTLLEERCSANLQSLGLSNTSFQSSLATTPLNWPLRATANLSDCSFYVISAYVDQNPAVGVFGDYNCGTRSYDGHRGTDIATTPFAFYKLDSSQVEIIAAAAGTIIHKNDGYFDRNCSTNTMPANYVIIQHADGSRALYWHMKMNSVTTKAIGQPVQAGEYLGVVGSSGSSTGPHLHFEVWSGATNATRVDPYAGACNTLNSTSWWAAQKPYTEPAVIRASLHTTDIVVPGCPNTETLNDQNCFVLPFQGAGLPPGAAKFYIFMRNETPGLTADVRILNPDGTIFNAWSHNSTASYTASWRAWTKNLPTIPGTYTFQMVYNGQTCSSTFDIMNPVITAGGSTTFCLGDSVLLSASAASAYVWNTGATTPFINVSTGGSYVVTITGSNGCTAVTAPVNVTQNSSPPTPVIASNGSLLLSSATSGNQWYLNGNPIPGAVNQGLVALESGQYVVVVTDGNGCTAAAAPFVFTTSGILEVEKSASFKVVPNPNAGIFTLEPAQGVAIRKILQISVYNQAGEHMAFLEMDGINLVNMAHLPAGIYLLWIVYEGGQEVQKVQKM